MLHQPFAEVCQHAFLDDHPVEVAPGDADASAGIYLPVFGSPNRMMVRSSVPPPKSKISTVCGSAERGFIIQGGCYRLELEINLIKPGFRLPPVAGCFELSYPARHPARI